MDRAVNEPSAPLMPMLGRMGVGVGTARGWALAAGVLLWAVLLLSAAAMPAVADEQLAVADEQSARHRPLQMSIIIDDIGNNRRLGRAAIELPGNLTFAVLPGLAHSRELAQLAHDRGRSVMLHMPMANHGGFPLGPMGLKMDMSERELRATLRAAMADVPHATGLNNHMGSLLTEQSGAMQTLMTVLAEEQMYFVDSLTTARSLAYSTAQDYGVPVLRRQVFLDHEQSDRFISGQFAQALSIMERTGSVILIGHPYPETIAFLAWIIPLLDEAGIALVTPEQLLADQSSLASAPAPLTSPR